MDTLTTAQLDHFILLATEIAKEAHREEFRADQVTPYVIHPIEVARRVRARLEGNSGNSYVLVAVIAALSHDILESDHLFPLKFRLLDTGIPGEIVGLAMESIHQLTNNTGGDYLDYLLNLKKLGNPISLLVKEEDMNCNWDDSERIPSAGRRKSLRTKWLLGHFILFGRKPYAALRTTS